MATKQAAKPAFALIKGAAEIKAAIDSIERRGKKLDQDIQLAALSVMQHHADHGDVTLINRLVLAMPKGSRVNALRDYIQCFGGVSYDEQAKAFVHVKGKLFDLDGACAKRWTDFQPEPDYKPFDAAKAIAALLKKLDNANADKGDKVTDEQAKAIRDMAAALGIQQ